MPQLTLVVAVGSVLTLTGPGGIAIPTADVRVARTGARNVLMDVPTRVWALGDPTTDSNAAEVVWIVPEGSYEVAVLGPATTPRTPQRTIERFTFDVRDSDAEILAQINALRAERAALDDRIRGLEARLTPKNE